MKRYRAPSLTVNTSLGDQTKLLNALRAVRGVQRATLRLATSQLEILARDDQEPTRQAITAAALGAGFAISG
jgi:hypothetical protein